MRVMVSQPMYGKTVEEIIRVRDAAFVAIESMGYEAVSSLFIEDSHPLYLLGKALEVMSTCQAVYFCKGWQLYRGCRIEHAAALDYGLQMLYEV